MLNAAPDEQPEEEAALNEQPTPHNQQRIVESNGGDETPDSIFTSVDTDQKDQVDEQHRHADVHKNLLRCFRS